MVEIKAPHNLVCSDRGACEFSGRPGDKQESSGSSSKKACCLESWKKLLEALEWQNSFGQSVGETSKGLNVHVWASEKGGRGRGAVRESQTQAGYSGSFWGNDGQPCRYRSPWAQKDCSNLHWQHCQRWAGLPHGDGCQPGRKKDAREGKETEWWKERRADVKFLFV